VLEGERLHHPRLLGHARGGAVELEEQRGLRLEALELRVADARAHLHVVEELDARDRDAVLHREDHRLHRPTEVGELAHRRRDRLGHAVEPELHLGDDAERAFLADEQAREVVTRRRLARTPAGAHDAPVRRDDGEAEHVLAHRAVAHGIGARCARRRHPADRRIGAGIDREEQSGTLEIGIQLLARHARLDAAVEVVGVHLDDPVHRRKVEAHAAIQRRDVALERRADAEGDHRTRAAWHSRTIAAPSAVDFG